MTIHIRNISLVVLVFFFSAVTTTIASADSQRDIDWHRADALILAGKNHEGIQLLDHVYSLTLHSTEPEPRKQLDEANILSEEIEPLRSTDDLARLKITLATFARLADLNSQPIASSFPPMKPTPERFAAERKFFKSGPDTGLSNDWLLDSMESSLIGKALQYAADARYADALSTLDQYRGDQPEFFWYYRAWIYAAQHKHAASVNAFFLVLYTHTANPSGMFFSIQVNAARYLSELPQNDLQ